MTTSATSYSQIFWTPESRLKKDKPRKAAELEIEWGRAHDHKTSTDHTAPNESAIEKDFQGMIAVVTKVPFQMKLVKFRSKGTKLYLVPLQVPILTKVTS